MKTITSTLKGTQKQFEHLYKTITLEDKDKELIPQEVETRIYVVEDIDASNLNDEEFMDLAEEEGRVYTLQGFQEAFNLEEINSAIDVIRIINVPV